MAAAPVVSQRFFLMQEFQVPGSSLIEADRCCSHEQLSLGFYESAVYEETQFSCFLADSSNADVCKSQAQ